MKFMSIVDVWFWLIEFYLNKSEYRNDEEWDLVKKMCWKFRDKSKQRFIKSESINKLYSKKLPWQKGLNDYSFRSMKKIIEFKKIKS